MSDMFSKRDSKTDYDASEAVAISLEGDTASCDSDAVTVDGSTVTITNEGVYVLSGQLNGMVIVNAGKEQKVQLVLDGASIASETSAALYVRLQRQFPGLSFTVSGGISSMTDIHMLDALHLHKVIVGKAFYENHITLEDIKSWSQSASSPASM